MGYSNRTWACPFYTWDERKKIHCEGGCLSFRDREGLAEYANRHCGSTEGWKGCTLAQSLMSYYDRQEE